MSAELPNGTSDRTQDNGHWVIVWTAMPQWTEDDNMPPEPFCNPIFYNSTLRQTLRITTGGQYVRIRISNAFGLDDLQVTAVTIALPNGEAVQNPTGSKQVHSETIQAIRFNGEPSVDIPTGAFALSDPVRFPIQARQVIAVNIFLRHGQTGGQITSHPGSRTQTWISRGDQTRAEDLNDPSVQSTFHWYFISGIEVWQPRHHCAFALIGDSITDGRCSTDNGNDRWPDLLFDRMIQHPYARNIAIVNQAAGGNRVLKDGLGPNVLNRLDRDVLGQPGIKYVMLFTGVNDIGTANPDTASQKEIGDRMIWAYKQISSRVHAFGIPIFCSTITPFIGPEIGAHSYSAATREETRQRINGWIRSSSTFDAVIDFDAVLQDPNNPSSLIPEYNSGDYLHPNVKAFQAMANSFPLELFQEFADGVQQFD